MPQRPHPAGPTAATGEPLVSVSAALAEVDDVLARGGRAAPLVLPTGFPLLDTYLGGGLRGGELCLLGGPQGLGKTAFVLQVARYAAASGSAAVVLSFEHDRTTLVERLVAIEAGDALGVEGVPLRRVRDALSAGRPDAPLEQRLARAPGAADALAALRSYGDRLLLHRAVGGVTDPALVAALAEAAAGRTGVRPLVVVDYLQKVHAPGVTDENAAVAHVVEALKDVALAADVPVLAVSAVEKEGLAPGRRLRVGHLRGPSALAYEPDVVLMMNEKVDCIARHHLLYDTRAADRYAEHVVLTIEKNRSGLARIDLQLRKRLEASRFDREIQVVPEELVDDRTS